MLDHLSSLQLKSLKSRHILRFAVFLTIPVVGLPAYGQTTSPPIRVGVFDEAKLFQARTDYPTLAAKVLPQVVARRKLTLVVTRQGFKWGTSSVPSVDVTSDVLVLLRALPVRTTALTGKEYAGAKRALDALNALRVATTVGGLTYDAYSTRLTNTAIICDDSLSTLPQGTLRTQLQAAMQGYLDARGTWDTCLTLISLKDQTLEAEYQRLLQLTPESDRPALQIMQPFKVEKMHQEVFKTLFEAWGKVAAQVDAAQKLMPLEPAS